MSTTTSFKAISMATSVPWNRESGLNKDQVLKTYLHRGIEPPMEVDVPRNRIIPIEVKERLYRQSYIPMVGEYKLPYCGEERIVHDCGLFKLEWKRIK